MIFPTVVAPDAHLRLPFKGGVTRRILPPRKRLRVKGFEGHIGNLSHNAWRQARKAGQR